MLNSGLTNHILSIVIIRIAFKFHTKWKKVVKQSQNRVNFILVVQVSEIKKGALQEYHDC